MSFANINDPAAVTALLEQLRASQAWKDLIHSGQPADIATAPSQSSSDASVAALLSQLQPADPPISLDADKPSQSPRSAPPAQPPSGVPSILQEPRNLRSYTFQQALPLIARLSSDPAFILEIQKLKKAQDDLERQLWEERRTIQRKHEEKVQLAKTKASMIGAGLSKHEADKINDAYRRELAKFDLEHALPAFDSLVAKQQTTLVQLNVPTMYVTDDPVAREGQQRVMQVLGGLIETPCSES